MHLRFASPIYSSDSEIAKSDKYAATIVPLFDILLGQRLGVLSLEQRLQRDELHWVVEAFAK